MPALVLPESSPEPPYSVFFTVVRFLIRVLIKFPGWQQVRRSCRFWHPARVMRSDFGRSSREAMRSQRSRERGSGRG